VFAKQLGKNAPLSNFFTFLGIYFFYHAMNLRRSAKSLVLGVQDMSEGSDDRV
jgi:hypothetical protein